MPRDKQTITPEDIGEVSPFAPGAVSPFDPSSGFTPPGQAEMEDSWTEDFTDIEGFGMIPEGVYPAMLVGLKKGAAKNGNPQYEWDFTITAGNSEAAGRKMKFWTSLVPQARWKIAETLEALGVPATGKVVTINRQELLNRPCLLDIYIDDQWDPQNPRSKIRKVLAPDTTAIKEAERRSSVPGV